MGPCGPAADGRGVIQGVERSPRSPSPKHRPLTVSGDIFVSVCVSVRACVQRKRKNALTGQRKKYISQMSPRPATFTAAREDREVTTQGKENNQHPTRGGIKTTRGHPCRVRTGRSYRMNAILTSCRGLRRSMTNTFVMRRLGALPISLITFPTDVITAFRHPSRKTWRHSSVRLMKLGSVTVGCFYLSDLYILLFYLGLHLG